MERLLRGKIEDRSFRFPEGMPRKPIWVSPGPALGSFVKQQRWTRGTSKRPTAEGDSLAEPCRAWSEMEEIKISYVNQFISYGHQRTWGTQVNEKKRIRPERVGTAYKPPGGRGAPSRNTIRNFPSEEQYRIINVTLTRGTRKRSISRDAEKTLQGAGGAVYFCSTVQLST